MADTDVGVLAWHVLIKQPVSNLSAQQVAFVASGWAGLMVNARVRDDTAEYTVATKNMSDALQELVRRSQDLDDKLVPRTEM